MTAAAAMALVSVGLLNACGTWGSDAGESPPRGRSTEGLCQLLATPLASMRQEGVDFVDILDPDVDDRVAVGAMLAFELPNSDGEAGAYEPTLRFLAKSFEARSDPDRASHPPAEASAEVRENAEQLDAEIRSGRCPE